MTAKLEIEVVVDKKALRALGVLVELCESLSEDFSYRDDVRRGLRAARYLMKTVRLDCSNVGVHLFEVDTE